MGSTYFVGIVVSCEIEYHALCERLDDPCIMAWDHYTQLCYSCKVPWEPDHRCRGKGKKHIIEVHYDSDDEDSDQSDDDSDSCTEASDSDSTSEDSDDDSCTEAMDACTLEEDDDPCVVDRQRNG
jgi:hypothetical protein